jgi:hypothetical protein
LPALATITHAGVVTTIACTCCERLFTPDEWRELQLVGYFDDTAGNRREQRSCDCSATLDIEAADALATAEGVFEALGAYLVRGRAVRRELLLRADDQGRIVALVTQSGQRTKVATQYDLATALERIVVTSYVPARAAE